MGEQDRDGFFKRGTEIFPATQASDEYVSELQAAVSGDIIWNPSFALWRDSKAWQKMRRDSDFEALIQLRRRMFASSDVTIEPGGDTPEDVAVASLFEQALDHTENFKKARYRLADAAFRGVTYAQIHGSVVETEFSVPGDLGERVMLEPMNWWVFDEFEDIGPDRVRLQRPTEKRGQFTTKVTGAEHLWHIYSIERTQWEVVERPDLLIRHTYEEAEDSLGYGIGLLDALWFTWYALQVLKREGLQGVTRWAQGIIMAKVDSLRDASTGKTNTILARNILTMLSKTLSRNVQVWDKTDEVETVSWDGKGHEILQTTKDDLLRSAYRLVMGALLPFGMAIDVGSNARAQQEQETSDDYLQYDYDSMSGDLSRPLVSIWRYVNGPNLAELGLKLAKDPKIVLAKVRRHDPKEQIQVVGEALASGIPLRKDEVYERIGFTRPADDDDVFGDLADAGNALDLDMEPDAPEPAPPEPAAVEPAPEPEPVAAPEPVAVAPEAQFAAHPKKKLAAHPTVVLVGNPFSVEKRGDEF